MRTPRLVLRNWREEDRSLFFEINSDDTVMEFFPFRRNRAQSDELMDRVRDGIEVTGFGFYAIQLTETKECIGFAGLAVANLEPVFPKDTIEIGWRLAARFWGNGYATEAATSLLEYGFADRGLTEIVSFAVHANHRSTAVMRRIGMDRDSSHDFDHPSVPETHPHLSGHVVYRLTRDRWLEIKNQKSRR